LHRAQQAQRRARQAHGGAEIHQALGVGLDVVVRQQLGGLRPQLALMACHGQVSVEREKARQHALHVAIENRDPLAKAERRNRRSGGAADAGQRLQHRATARKCTAMLGHHRLSAGVQVARAAVVAEATPQAHDLVLRRGGQRLHIGESLQKALVVAEHRGHLRLLQHDF
jgi:hypothetical protein